MNHMSAARLSGSRSEAIAQRRRARRFWGMVGVMQRVDDRRFTRTEVRLRGAGDMQTARVSARIFRGM